MASLAEHRRFFAEFIVRSAGSADGWLIDVFAAVTREQHLGPGPWPVFAGSGDPHTPDVDSAVQVEPRPSGRTVTPPTPDGRFGAAPRIVRLADMH
jgi:hypothetical protein